MAPVPTGGLTVRPLFSLVPIALAVGFLAGHGFELPFELLPLLLSITVAFLVITVNNLMEQE